MNKLFFKNIPRFYKVEEKIYLIGLDISGIQKYIFNVSNNNKSLQEVKKRSLEISELTHYLYRAINKNYKIVKDQIITLNSGKLIFTMKLDINLDDLINFIKSLQKDVFLTYNGELNIFYGVVKTTITDEPYHHQETAYHELLKEIQLNKRHSYELLEYNHKTSYHQIQLNVDFKDGQLIDDLSDKSSQHQYITGIKFDFDDLGMYFGKIGQSDEVLKESQKIIDRIDRALKQTSEMYKIFSGGDDIFILVNFYNTFNKLLEIKKYLEKEFTDLKYDFGISAGIAVFKKQTSIVYYGEKLEEELANAKTNGKNGISIEGRFFKWDAVILIRDYINTTIVKLKNTRLNYLSQLANIENTLKSIMQEDDMNTLIKQFILKIPLFLDKLPVVINNELLSYETNRKVEYFQKIERFYISIKFLNRYLRKEK